MAGDWIKIEHTTMDKPEVTLLAEILGLPVDHGLGLLVRFWAWLDKNSCNGCVTHVSRLSIDTVMHTPGFGAAIEAVGWLEFDEKKRTARIPNFDRHNTSSAKSRALTTLRVQRHRNAQVTETKLSAVTKSLPEKRRDKSTTIQPLNSGTAARPPVDKSTPGHKNGLNVKGTGSWRRDPDAAERKARSLGIKSQPGETTEHLVHRIDELEERQGRAAR